MGLPRFPHVHARRLPTLLVLLACASPAGAQTPAQDRARPPEKLGPPTAEELEGHRKMLALLEEVRRTTPRQNVFLGDGQLKKLEEARAKVDASTPLKTLAKFDYEIGNQLLHQGRNDEAVASLMQCEERLRPLPRESWPPFAERLYYDLGIACMRKGESDNCIAHHTARSCLLPIEGDGAHVAPEGSRQAMHWFREVMKSSEPDSDLFLCSRWLLNIAAMTLRQYPDGLSAAELIPPATFASEAEFPRFPDVAPELGLNFLDTAGGAVVDDFDNDGLLDLFQSSWDTGNALHFCHNNGDGTFADRSREANLDGLAGGLNLVQADADGDGWTDLFVLRGAWLSGSRGQIPKSLLQNRGGTFLDVTIRAGLNENAYPSQAAAFADYDLDGDLDLYVGSEANPDNLFPGLLFQNQGNGTFSDVAEKAGVENVRYCKGVTWGDYDGDRWPDLYASNLNSKNRLYHNEGNGKFVDVAEKLGVTRPIQSFPTWFWDYDNDGALDLYVAGYFNLKDPEATLRLAPVVRSYLGLPFDSELACLYRGDGHGGFTEVGEAVNLKRLTLPMGANFGDLDNDGFIDFYLGTGYPQYEGLIPNVMYWNRGGRKFLDISAAGGFGHLQKGHGVAFADVDQDGDQDVFEQMGGAYKGDAFADVLFRNPGFGNHWLEVKLTGVRTNRSAIGARIRADFVDAGEKRSVYRWVNSGGSFGANPFMQHLGLGKAERVARLEVYWPASDTTQVFADVPVDVRLELVEGAAEYQLAHPRPFRLGGG